MIDFQNQNSKIISSNKDENLSSLQRSQWIFEKNLAVNFNKILELKF